MKLIRQNKRWEVLSTYQERHLIPRQKNGKSFFQWNHQDAPDRWSTDRARVAAMLAQYADDAVRAEIVALAGKEPDPDAPTLLHDGATYRYYSSIALNHAARDAGFEFTREPSPAHWWTQDPDRAVRCYQVAMHYEGFTCPAAIQAVLMAHLEAQQAHIDASRVVGLDVELPRPAGLDYLPFQKAAIVYAMQRRNVLFGDEMGLGKTIEALGLINALNVRSALIVVPATLKLNWLQECQKWLLGGQRVGIATSKSVPFACDIVIVNFEALGVRETPDACYGCTHRKAEHVGGGLFPCLGRHEGGPCHCPTWAAPDPVEPTLRPDLDRDWELLVIDECFPAATKVLTSIGWRSIGEIVHNTLPLRVASCNLETGELEWKRIRRWVQKLKPEFLYEVSHEWGTLTCTGNHKIWTERGYVRADEIVAGDYLRVVSGVLPGASSRQGSTPTKVLRDELFGTMADESAGLAGAALGYYEDQVRRVLSGRSRGSAPAHASQQSDKRSGGNSQNQRLVQRTYFPWAWGQWFIDRAAAIARRCAASADGVGDRDRSGQGSVSVPTEPLQGRPGSSRGASRYRGGRPQSRYTQVEISGQTQDVGFERSRVVCVEIQKQRGFSRYSSVCPGGPFVYNLEVEGHHNYVADGVLVSNCHRIKNPKTQRARLSFSIRAERSAFLSGTPLPNRPKELWTLLNHLAPEVFSKQWEFWKRYCGASRDNGWDKDGASNLDELQSKMRSSVMVRRLKSEVLTELPPKRRQVLEFPAGALMRFASAEQDAWRRRESLRLELRTRVELAKASDDPADYAAAVKALQQGMKVAFSEIAKLRHDTAVAKIPLVVQHVENVLESEPKYVIFAHHIDVIEALVKHFGTSAVAVYGATSEADRIARKDRFNTDDSCRVFIGGIFVAGVGLSLRCSKLGFAELDWVPGNVTQCEDRCHGVGRGVEGEPLLVQHLMLEGSLDANMARTIVEKQEVADRTLDRRSDAEPEPLDPAFEFEPEALVLADKQDAVAPADVAELPSTHGATPEWIVKTAAKLSPADVALVYQGLRQLAGMCDGAASRDGVGFNGYDVKIGHGLASQASLTQKQAALGLRLCRKYNHSQLGGMLDALYEREA